MHIADLLMYVTE